MYIRVQLFKEWIVQLVSLILTLWIVIYLVDSAMQLLSNWGQIETGSW